MYGMYFSLLSLLSSHYTSTNIPFLWIKCALYLWIKCAIHLLDMFVFLLWIKCALFIKNTLSFLLFLLCFQKLKCPTNRQVFCSYQFSSLRSKEEQKEEEAWTTKAVYLKSCLSKTWKWFDLELSRLKGAVVGESVNYLSIFKPIYSGQTVFHTPE